MNILETSNRVFNTMKQLDLDWSVEKAPLFTGDNVEAEGYFAVQRSDNRNILANLLTLESRLKHQRFDSYAYKVGVLQELKNPIRSVYYGMTLDQIIQEISILSDEIVRSASEEESINLFL